MNDTVTYLAEKFSEAVKLVHTMEVRLKNIEDDLMLTRKEFIELRSDSLKFESRLSHLEEARNTLSAEMKTLKAETVSDLRDEKSQMRVELEKAKNEITLTLERDYAKRRMELEVQFLNLTNSLQQQFTEAVRALPPAPSKS